jgi:hypothetical protein
MAAHAEVRLKPNAFRKFQNSIPKGFQPEALGWQTQSLWDCRIAAPLVRSLFGSFVWDSRKALGSSARDRETHYAPRITHHAS